MFYISSVIAVKPFGIIPVHPFYSFRKSCNTVYVQERKPWLFLMLRSFQNKYRGSAKMAIRPQVSMAILYANLSISCYYQFQGQQLKKKSWTIVKSSVILFSPPALLKSVCNELPPCLKWITTPSHTNTPSLPAPSKVWNYIALVC